MHSMSTYCNIAFNVHLLHVGIGAGVESMSIDQIGPISKVNPKVGFNSKVLCFWEVRADILRGCSITSYYVNRWTNLHKPETVFFLWESHLKMWHNVLGWQGKNKTRLQWVATLKSQLICSFFCKIYGGNQYDFNLVRSIFLNRLSLISVLL